MRLIKCVIASIAILMGILGGQSAARADIYSVGAPSDVGLEIQALVLSGHTPRIIQYDVVSTAWIILYDTNGYVGYNMPPALTSALNTVQSQGYAITNIAFTPSGGWVFFYGVTGYWANNIPTDCFNKIASVSSSGYHLKSVTFAPNGAWALFFGANGAWLVGADSTLINSVVAVQNTSGDTLTSISYAPNNGWVFFFRNAAGTSYFYYENVEPSLVYNMQQFEKAFYPFYTLTFVPGTGSAYSLFYHIGTYP